MQEQQELEEYGNQSTTGNIAYIIGDSFAELSQLPGVLTVTQFFKALFGEELPHYRFWMVGQGVDGWVRYILQLCAEHSRKIHLQFIETEIKKPVTAAAAVHPFEWSRLQFVDGTRVQANLTFVNLDEAELFSQTFLIQAAKELNERACIETSPGSKISVKYASFQRFQQTMPLPITVETQFELQKNDNKRSMKSLTRFYQDRHCIAEISLVFDFYTATEASQLLKNLGHKTFESFSSRAG